MPLIACYNISPLIPVDLRYVRTDKPTDEDLVYFKRMKAEGPVVPPPFTWREQIEKIIVSVTCEHFGIKPDAVSCCFPHDPSTPANPYPIATIDVSLLYRKPERTPEVVKQYREKLGRVCRDFLNKLRNTTDAKVEVATHLCDPDDVTTIG